ncbi:MAG: alpha/beta hydrolase [Bacteroidetes bacterium]|nr:MAG: alpha/beta hydrolase [Bacteroidota bacterium]
MKYRFLPLALGVVLWASCSKEEDPQSCNNCTDSGRYSQALFAEVEVDSLQYDATHNLWMNIYTPKDDSATDRRVVLLAHGGAFVSGNRNNPVMVDYATRLAEYGYVAISYDYRLASSPFMMIDSVQSLYVVANALADGNTVLEQVIASHASGNPHGIDPDKIALAGNSAGAVLSLHMGHMDQNDAVSTNLQAAIDSAGGWSAMHDPTSSNRVKAVISLAGGIVNPSWLNANGPELIMAHGTWDNIVPYGCGHVLNNSPSAMELCGSEPIATQANAIGLENASLIFPELQHCPWNNSSALADQVFDFLTPELKAAMD